MAMATSSSAKSAAASNRSAEANAGSGPCTLTIDIGGSHIKATVLDRAGTLLAKRVRVETPVGSPPAEIVGAIADLVTPLPPFDRISVGFPGAVRSGVVLTAPNLGHDGWQRFDLAAAITAKLGRP